MHTSPLQIMTLTDALAQVVVRTAGHHPASHRRAERHDYRALWKATDPSVDNADTRQQNQPNQVAKTQEQRSVVR